MPKPARKAMFFAAIKNISNGSGHPVQIALRTYALCLSLSLGPALFPVVFSPRPKTFGARASAFLRALLKELRPTGFASAMSIAVGGGVTLQQLWDSLGHRYAHRWTRVHPYYRAFLANVFTSTLAVILLRWRRRRRLGSSSPTLDLSLFFLVRALDASVQALLLEKTRETALRHLKAVSRNDVASRPSEAPDARTLDERSRELAKEWRNKAATRLDALVFWACSARIMWCFFYQPQRLPRSYVKWINSLAHVDGRLLEILRALREGRWSYIRDLSTEGNILGPLADKLGYPPSWVDPAALPAYGGDSANEAWKQLRVDGRSGIGGLPCELVHGHVGAKFGLGNSCTANAAIRAMYAFAEALVIYLPVHFLPILFTRLRSIMRLDHSIPAFLSAIRSATFLSTFLSSYWFTVCFTRTLVLARLFPMISHDVWDGPYGCTLAGSLVCGASIWIENARRRGEMALYVLPRALRSLVSEEWLRSRHSAVQFAECSIFILSLASLLTFSVHQPETLRGLSKWASTFIIKGPNGRKREISTYPPAPVDSSVPDSWED